jgi:peptidoglycan-associated lipoprotein
MKIPSITTLLALTVILSTSVVGCKKGLQKTTPLPGRGSSQIGEGGPGGLLDPSETMGDGGGITEDSTGSIPFDVGMDFSDWTPDRATFSENTIYFDFDSSVVKVSEVPKLEAVAAAMQTMGGMALRVEGHCDERGTEEYNRSLGERRALSVRETLIQAGMNPSQIETVTYGEDQPAELGHNEGAWAANRRGEIVLLSPPGAN